MNPLDYKSPSQPNSPPCRDGMSYGTRISIGFTCAAVAIGLVSVIGVANSGFTMSGFAFGALMLISWLCSLIAIAAAICGAVSEPDRRAFFALAVAILIPVVLYLLTIVFPGESLGNIH